MTHPDGRGDDEPDTTTSQSGAQDAAVVDALLSNAETTSEGGSATLLDRDTPPAGRGATVLDSAGASIRRSSALGGQRVRVNLPEPLAARFETVETITRGAEADLLVVADRSSGERRVIKLYRQSAARIEAGTLEMLASADRKHVVEIYNHGEWDGEWWEEMEYCPLGSLEDLLVAEAGDERLPDQLVREIIDEIVDALEHLHSLPSDGKPLVHRDLKPANILVRKRERPLDLVVADFGLARVINASRDMRSRSRTVEYAAPEASWGEVSPARDWWSLGIIVVEVATGHHPFCYDDGTPMEQPAIEAHLQRRPIDVSAIRDPDPRLPDLRLLARGLLVADAEHRWGIEQVRAWQVGKVPPVHEGRFTRSKSTISFVSGGHEYNDPVLLAEDWSRDWDRAAEIVSDAGKHRRERTALKDFLRSCDFSAEDLTRLEVILTTEGESSHRQLTELLRQIDPTLPAIYRGRSIERKSLSALSAKAAGGDAEARAILANLYDDEVLRLHSHLAGCEGYAAVEHRWHTEGEVMSGHLRSITADLPGQRRDALDELEWTARAILLSLLLEQGGNDLQRRQLDDARADHDALEVNAYARLARAAEPPPAAAAALLAGRPAARQVGASIRERREQEQREQRARQRAVLTSMLFRSSARTVLGSVVMGGGVFAAALALSFEGGVAEPGALIATAVGPSIVSATAICIVAVVVHEIVASRSTTLRYLGRVSQIGWLYIPALLAAAAATLLQLPSGSGLMPLQRWPLAVAAYTAVFLLSLAVRVADVREGAWLERLRTKEPRVMLLAVTLLVGATAVLLVDKADQSAIDSQAIHWQARSGELARVSAPRCSPVPFDPESALPTMQGQVNCEVIGVPVQVSWFRDHAGLAAYNNSIVRPTGEVGPCKYGKSQVGTLSPPGEHFLLGRFYCYIATGSHMDWTYDPVNVFVSTSPPDGGLSRAYQVYRHFHFDYGSLYENAPGQ